MDQFNLSDLSLRLQRDKEILSYPKRDWAVKRHSQSKENIYDCLIIGAGQSGLGVAQGLLSDKVSNILVIDENEVGHEGPWRSFARMPHLRTPKNLTGLDYGNPHLTFKSYFEARFGKDAYHEHSFIPTDLWADYLDWYREEMAIPVSNLTRAVHIRFDEQNHCLAASYQKPQEEGILLAKTVVLANGIDGSGRWCCPDIIKDNVPPDRYFHTRDPIDFTVLEKKRVGILGAGASAFDNALMALNARAESVHLFSRRETLPFINPYRWAEFVGFLKHHGDLSDAMRWQFIHQIALMGQLPPKTTFERVMAQSKFKLELGQAWQRIAMVSDEISVQTSKGVFMFDYLIVGTGFITDLACRPELSAFKDYIATWQDRFKPPPDLVNQELSRHPYLGPAFELQEISPGQAPYLSSIFCYNFGCLLSLGLGGGSISGLKYSLPKVVAGVTKRLFVDDCEHYLEELHRFQLAEYDPVINP